MLKDKFEDFVLAADIGATWSKIGVYGVKTNKRPGLIFKQVYKSQEVKGLIKPVKQVVNLAKDKFHIKVTKAGLGVAGIVDYDKNECWLTNGKFWIKEKELERLGLKNVVMHNDFVANGYAIPYLKKNEFVTLPHPNKRFPKPAKKENIACIGAGSGLGHCIVSYYNGKRLPIASEAGHVDFPAMDNLETELVEWYKKKFKMPAFYESFVSGPGIVNIYMFLRQKEKKLNNFDKEFDKIRNIAFKSIFITQNYKQNQLFKKSVRLFIKFYARAARNFALSALAKNGVYIAGGIAPNLIPEFIKFRFTAEFEKNKTYHSALKNMPVYIVTYKDLGLLGAALSALNPCKL